MFTRKGGSPHYAPFPRQKINLALAFKSNISPKVLNHCEQFNTDEVFLVDFNDSHVTQNVGLPYFNVLAHHNTHGRLLEMKTM